MKLANFKFECTPFRYSGSMFDSGIKEIRFTVIHSNHQVSQFKEIVSLETMPDDLSLIDYVFERAKLAFEEECKEKGK